MRERKKHIVVGHAPSLHPAVANLRRMAAAMKKTLTAYLAALLFLLVADGIWLGLLMPQQYQAWIGPLMRAQPPLLPAAAFYLLYPVGVVVFAVLPALARQSWTRCAALGALLGLLAYGTYDLSNLATLQG